MKSKNSLQLEIIAVLKEIRPEYLFSENLNFIEEGMLDSFDIINLVTMLDEKFNISIDGMDILPENFESVDSIHLLLLKNNVSL